MPKSAPEFFFEPVPHAEAAEFIAGKPVVSREVYAQLLPELKSRAFAISGVTVASVAQGVRDRIAELPQGGDWNTIKRQIVEDIHPFVADPENPDNTRAAEKRAELLLRTHGFQAYQATSYAVMDRQRDAFPYWQYLSMDDGRVRATHAALDGRVIRAEHLFWDTHFPPWEWGCRCQAIPLTEADADELRAEDADKPMEDRRVLEPPVLDQLARTGQLHLGPTNIHDIRSAKEKGDPNGFHWSPADLRLDLAQLKGRYDPEVWTAFEAWAKKSAISPNRSVWEWLGGTLRKPGDWPPAVGEMKPVKKLGGSTGADLVEDPETGERFVRKAGASADHLLEETAADALYRALGIAVPEARVYPTPAGPIKLARFIQGTPLRDYLAKSTPDHREAALARLREHFVADALLGNWDVVGLDLDNVLIDSAGIPWRIDNGGALRFRAQGKPKTAAEWGPTVHELASMRDPNRNAQTAKIFAGITDAEIQRQAAKILGQREALLDAAPPALRDMLAARLDDLALRLAPPGEITPAFAKDVIKSRILGRTYLGDFEHVEDHSILFWQERDAAGQPVTRAKLRFTEAGWQAIQAKLGAQLTTASPTLASGPQPVPGDTYWPALEAALKTVGKHAADGAYNAATLAAFEAKAAQVAAIQHTDPEVLAMKATYLDIIAAVRDAIAKRQSPAKKFAQYLIPPKAAAAAPTRAASAVKVESTPFVYSSKSRDRGHAREGTGDVKTISGAYRITLGDAELVFAPWDRSTPYAHRGVAALRVRGEATPERMQAALSLLDEIGVDARPTPPATTELVYLKKGLSFAKPDADWRDILVGTGTDGEKVDALKAWMRSHRMGKLLDAADYQPAGQGNTWGDGWRTWQRFDLPPAKMRAELPGYGLAHESSTPPPQLVEAFLNGGGQVTPTMERLRVGVPLSSGMSTERDQQTGGANYFFTRIADAARVTRHRGLVFKIDRLARLDAQSFAGDIYGDVRPAAENEHIRSRGIHPSNDPHQARGRTIANYRAQAKRSTNETIFKNGLNFLDDIDQVRTASAAERQLVLEAFARHGITHLPDGRAVTDIVK